VNGWALKRLKRFSSGAAEPGGVAEVAAGGGGGRPAVFVAVLILIYCNY